MDDTKPSTAKSMEVESFLLRFPEQMRPAYRRLLYYAAMPLVLTPELLHYLRNAFVREAPWVAEADLLLADNLFEEKNFEQYVMATQVRTLLLREAVEQLGERNMQEAARLLVSYLYRHLPFSSLSPSEVTAQRWAALLYLDDYHDKVVAEIVQALHEALSASDAVSSYEGRAAFESMLEVINQIAPTLADQPVLVDLARLTQGLLHEEIDPRSISQERLMQSPMVAGIQLPSLDRIIGAVKTPVPAGYEPGNATSTEGVQVNGVERRYQMRVSFPKTVYVGETAALVVDIVGVSDDSDTKDSWPPADAEQDVLYETADFTYQPPAARDGEADAIFRFQVTASNFEIADEQQTALQARAIPGMTVVRFYITAMQEGAAALFIDCYAENRLMATLKTECAVFAERDVVEERAIAPSGSQKTTVLFLAANPVDTPQIRLDAEARAIQRIIENSNRRDVIEFQSHWAVTVDDLTRIFRSHVDSPLIVHFSGHGTYDEILLEGEDGRSTPLPAASLRDDMTKLRAVQCVVLNFGDSNIIANSLAEVVPCVIGMGSAISDIFAIEFAEGFYRGVAAGLSYREAFNMALVGLELEGIHSAAKPVFIQGKSTTIEGRGDTGGSRVIVPPLTTITGAQHRQLADALADAFNLQSLTEMVRAKLGRSLDSFANVTNTKKIITFELVEWAKRSGYLTELLQGALDTQPRNQKLRDFAKSVGAREGGLSDERQEQAEEMLSSPGSSSRPSLSDRQRKILEFLIEFWRTHSYYPTIRQIGVGTGISSSSVVNYNLNKLERFGLIERNREQSRGVELNRERLKDFGFEVDDIQSSESSLEQSGSKISPPEAVNQPIEQALPADSNRLSERQMAILQFIVNFLDAHHYPPTIREIGNAIGVSSTSVVNYNLNKLESLGLLERQREVMRGISLNRNRLEEFGLDIQASSKAVRNESKAPKSIRVPILGSISTGVPMPTKAAAELVEEWIEISADLIKNEKQLFGLRAKGDFLQDASITDGDILIVRQQQWANDGDLVLAWLTETYESMVGTLFHRGEAIELRPPNPSYESIHIPDDKVVVEGIVVIVIRSKT